MLSSCQLPLHLSLLLKSEPTVPSTVMLHPPGQPLTISFTQDFQLREYSIPWDSQLLDVKTPLNWTDKNKDGKREEDSASLLNGPHETGCTWKRAPRSCVHSRGRQQRCWDLGKAGCSAIYSVYVQRSRCKQHGLRFAFITVQEHPWGNTIITQNTQKLEGHEGAAVLLSLGGQQPQDGLQWVYGPAIDRDWKWTQCLHQGHRGIWGRDKDALTPFTSLQSCSCTPVCDCWPHPGNAVFGGLWQRVLSRQL